MSIFLAAAISRAPTAGLAAVGVFWGGFAAYVPDIKAALAATDAVWGVVMILSAIGGMTAMYLGPSVLAILGRATLPAAAEGEFYWDDLTGLAVLNRSGVLLGEVLGITQHGAHPLLRVARLPGAPGPERLIPFVAAIIDRVDIGAGRIEVDWSADY